MKKLFTCWYVTSEFRWSFVSNFDVKKKLVRWRQGKLSHSRIQMTVWDAIRDEEWVSRTRVAWNVVLIFFFVVRKLEFTINSILISVRTEQLLWNCVYKYFSKSLKNFCFSSVSKQWLLKEIIQKRDHERINSFFLYPELFFALRCSYCSIWWNEKENILSHVIYSLKKSK